MATKREGGKDFKAGDYAYVPDAAKPSTWKLRLTNTPGGAPDRSIVGAAVAALGKGFRGRKVQIPSGSLAAVKSKVRTAWLKANSDKTREDLPAVLKSADLEEASLDPKEIYIELADIDKSKRIVYGIVLEPDSVDTQGDTISAEAIERSAHNFMISSRIIGKQHQSKAKADPVESFIAPDDFKLGGQEVKKGSWVMGVKVHDDAIWKGVLAGEFTGFSVGGMAKRKEL